MNVAVIRQFPVNFQDQLKKLLQNMKDNFAAQLQKLQTEVGDKEIAKVLEFHKAVQAN